MFAGEPLNGDAAATSPLVPKPFQKVEFGQIDLDRARQKVYLLGVADVLSSR
jgi:hypothetical protein